METLKEIDFEFIDYNKTRIEKLNKWFMENGKGNIVTVINQYKSTSI
jgi:hypothetical protein